MDCQRVLVLCYFVSGCSLDWTVGNIMKDREGSRIWLILGIVQLSLGLTYDASNSAYVPSTKAGSMFTFQSSFCPSSQACDPLVTSAVYWPICRNI